jgi:rhamnosyltransferase
MKQNGICAVVVTFRPGAAVFENLAKVRLQVDHVLVVDNGSSSESLAPFLALTRGGDITLIENQANLGIAAALNAGVRWAKSQGFEYVALFDQDSTVTEEFMATMLAEYTAHPRREWVALVTPTQMDRNSGLVRRHACAKDGGPLVAITSGGLMPVSIFERCGWFEEQLIIDGVDHEYCFRVRSQGYTLAECRKALLIVAVGSIKNHQILGLTITAKHYSAKRRYYITRNRLVIVGRFWKQQPAWCYRALRDVVHDTVKVLFWEEQRSSKLAHTARGIIDALSGRMGKNVEL